MKLDVARQMPTYTSKQHQKASRLEKMRMHLVEPDRFDLDEYEWKHFEQIKAVFYLSINEISRGVAIGKVRAMEPGMTTKYANELYDQAQELFGSFVQTNQMLNKGKITERLSIMADKAFAQAIYTYKDEDGHEQEGTDMKYMELCRRLLADIAQINGYNQSERKIDPKLLTIPKLIITSDPNAFLRSRGAEKPIEDAETE